MSILQEIGKGKKIRELSMKELYILAEEIRGFLIDKVMENGGHLASNLGIVELTIALHYVFDFPDDKIIWDVGHQSYVHKILSGRAKDFDTLRKLGGISGFPKTSESPYDCFNTGHASTSVSAAAGMAKARDLKGEKNHIIAVIGDGSLGGGLAYEAINDIGNNNTNTLIILNDNKMSIAKNVGGMSRHLNSIRMSGKYVRLKQRISIKLENKEGLFALLKRTKDFFKRALVKNTVFGELGLNYFGPFDGHNIEQLIHALKHIKRLDKGVVMHVRTIKGKGYTPAENKPQEYHGISAHGGTYREDYSAVFGKKLTELAKNNKKIFAITAAMPQGTGLTEFSKIFKNRFLDVGIAEEHAVTTAAGMAANGLVPVVAIYSTFMQRAFDETLHDVCLQGLHVVLCADRAGIVGADGETHQGVFDLSYMRIMPGISIFSPSCYNELETMLDYAVNKMNSPVVIRYPRGCEERNIEYKKEFAPGKAEMLIDGKDILILACGSMVNIALTAAEKLNGKGLSAAVADLRSVLPLDKEFVIENARCAKLIVTLEDNVKSGGVGEMIAALLMENSIKAELIIKAYESGIIEQGSQNELKKILRLDSGSICDDILKRLEK